MRHNYIMESINGLGVASGFGKIARACGILCVSCARQGATGRTRINRIRKEEATSGRRRKDQTLDAKKTEARKGDLEGVVDNGEDRWWETGARRLGRAR